jgi:hypothetical protein
MSRAAIEFLDSDETREAIVEIEDRCDSDEQLDRELRKFFMSEKMRFRLKVFMNDLALEKKKKQN